MRSPNVWKRVHIIAMCAVVVGILGVALASTIAPALFMEWRRIVTSVLAVPVIVFIISSVVWYRACSAHYDDALNQLEDLKREVIANSAR